jgi:hypothetical protein
MMKSFLMSMAICMLIANTVFSQDLLKGWKKECCNYYHLCCLGSYVIYVLLAL